MRGAGSAAAGACARRTRGRALRLVTVPLAVAGRYNSPVVRFPKLPRPHRDSNLQRARAPSAQVTLNGVQVVQHVRRVGHSLARLGVGPRPPVPHPRHEPLQVLHVLTEHLRGAPQVLWHEVVEKVAVVQQHQELPMERHRGGQVKRLAARLVQLPRDFPVGCDIRGQLVRGVLYEIVAHDADAEAPGRVVGRLRPAPPQVVRVAPARRLHALYQPVIRPQVPYEAVHVDGEVYRRKVLLDVAQQLRRDGVKHADHLERLAPARLGHVIQQLHCDAPPRVQQPVYRHVDEVAELVGLLLRARRRVPAFALYQRARNRVQDRPDERGVEHEHERHAPTGLRLTLAAGNPPQLLSSLDERAQPRHVRRNLVGQTLHSALLRLPLSRQLRALRVQCEQVRHCDLGTRLRQLNQAAAQPRSAPLSLLYSVLAPELLQLGQL
ncbi:polyketide synthase [Babesia caballi]|uniref:Polyketide synthase n=1 Tax=Babesia caballi TaxID=5871 RepID=A0AAV4M307_BABCB|nr:polyketide synthase [Babesia caballi]